jgi:flagellar hook-length control protein FliK
MSIETGPTTALIKPVATKAAASAKSQGTGKDAPNESLGFSAILAAEEAPEGGGQAIQSPDVLETMLPSAPVDVAQSAINIVANPTPQPTIPVILPGTEATELAKSAVGTSRAMTAAAKEQLPLVAATGGAVVSANQDSKITPAGVDNKAAKAVLAPPSSVVDSGKQHDSHFFAVMEAMKFVQTAKEPPSATVGVALAASGLAEPNKPEKAVLQAEAAPLTYAATVPTLGTTSYASTAVADASNVSPEMQVAEQVTYWISQDVQNAALTLEGLGKDPVEVSIRMSGNEAQVSFRTDELQTRDLLENAASHLKELLQSEGLVLTGVSVGTSGSGDAGTGQQRPFHGSRQTMAMVPEHTPAAPIRAPLGAQGRSLDLFV